MSTRALNLNSKRTRAKSDMSSDSEVTSSPEEGSYSRGSSVSTGLREEYEELLQYAVVTPKFDGKIVSNNDTVTRTTHLSQTIPHEVTNTAGHVTMEESTPDDQPTTGILHTSSHMPYT